MKGFGSYTEEVGGTEGWAVRRAAAHQRKAPTSSITINPVSLPVRPVSRGAPPLCTSLLATKPATTTPANPSPATRPEAARMPGSPSHPNASGRAARR